MTPFSIAGLGAILAMGKFAVSGIIIVITIFIIGTVFLALFIHVLALTLGNILPQIGNYYPNWYYLPKLRMNTTVTPENDIEVTITNPKKSQKMTLRAVYARMHYDVRPPNVLVSGVAPDSVKELLPLSSMNGICSRRKKSGELHREV